MDKKYRQVLKAIKKYNDIVILRHEVPDFDASGSQFGLETFIKDNYPNKNVYSLGKPHKFFSPTLYPESIENVHIEKGYLCIVLDTANIERIDAKQYMNDAGFVIKIDHHPECEKYGDISIVDPHAAATAELLGLLLVASKKKISSKCAYYLYSAIVGDSGRFQYSDTSNKTFKVVSELFKTNFNFQEIYDLMYLKSKDEIEVIKYLYDVVKYSKKGVAYYILTQQEFDKLGIEREKSKAYVNLFGTYKEIAIWVQVTEDVTASDEYKWRVSLRSRGIKINDVASHYHGGGHDNAAGAKCASIEEIQAMIEELDNLL